MKPDLPQRSALFRADDLRSARKAFSHAVRAGDHGAASQVIRQAFQVRRTAAYDPDWADFAYRSIRAITAHIPAPEKLALLLEFICRFPADAPSTKMAAGIIRREADVDTIMAFFARRPHHETPAWVEELRSGLRRQLARDFFSTVRAGEYPAAAEVILKALAQDCPEEEEATWASFLLLSLRAVAGRLEAAGLKDLHLQFIDRFIVEPTLAEPVAQALLRKAGSLEVDDWVAAARQPDLAQALYLRLMRMGAKLPEDAPGLLENGRPALRPVVRAAAVRLGGQASAQPSEVVIFIGKGMAPEVADACAQAFADPAATTQFLFDDADEVLRHRDRLSERTGLAGDRFAALPGFDLRTDNTLFSRCEAVVDALFDAVLADPEAVSLPQPFLQFHGDIRGGVVDRLVSVVRKLEGLRAGDEGAGAALEPRRLIICPASRADAMLAHDLVEVCHRTEVVLAVPPVLPGARALVLEDPMPLGTAVTMTRNQQALEASQAQAAIQRAKGQETIFYVNLADRQYLQTVMALGDHAPAPVLVLSPSEAHADLERREAAGKPANLDVCQITTTALPFDEDPAFQRLATVFERAISGVRAVGGSTGVTASRGVVARLGQVVLPVCGLAISHAGFFADLFAMPGLRVFVVTPGRSFQARIGVSLARQAGIATVDVQAGAISRLRRFREPVADLVTCIDRPHWDIYRNHYGLPQVRVSVTGSARIDALLAPLRHLDRATVRRQTLGVRGEEPVLFLASQPIEVERMVAIADIAMRASDRGWRVVLKPHPGEREHHLAAYHAVRARMAHPERIVIDRDLDVYQVVLASDAVATYYSTVGQEAFALRRPVVVIDPFETPPDLDYVAIGLASRARDTDELAQVLASKSGGAEHSADPYLAVLQDGRAAERVWRTIREGKAVDPAAEPQSIG